MERISETLTKNIKAFRRSKKKCVFLNKLVSSFGIKDIAYFCLRSPKDIVSKRILFTTYSEDWEDHYFSRNYNNHDPIIIEGVKSSLPLDWCKIKKQSATNEVFFNEASEFGISHKGITIPIRGAYEDLALLSISTDMPEEDWAYTKQHLLPDLPYFGMLIHEEIIGSQITARKDMKNLLSPREKEVLY
ncbi:hypothetical protein F9L33_12305 [Amylibacter sp. SFDW26]|uniref:autoinducer binding domain-containing protein n=1 Tax=Amylibacter sp. SFDW26 TaxID=2652722 RepID=UPI001261A750|nr:autoinducer binding domain-containing protein [Amylibacter sp. SFDW26]KAB7613377.1 hypothetical protein F9L33_12305 [Amylibacter sp. SFDW26]